MNRPAMENSEDARLRHDINATLSSLMNALELVQEEWKENRSLVEKILPLTTEKMQKLQEQIHLYYNR